jgi:hypothetical protein
MKWYGRSRVGWSLKINLSGKVDLPSDPGAILDAAKKAVADALAAGKSGSDLLSEALAQLNSIRDNLGQGSDEYAKASCKKIEDVWGVVTGSPFNPSLYH